MHAYRSGPAHKAQGALLPEPLQLPFATVVLFEDGGAIAHGDWPGLASYLYVAVGAKFRLPGIFSKLITS